MLEIANNEKQIYDGKTIIVQMEDGGESSIYICPVCSKVYKRRDKADTHLAEKSCASAVAVFQGTITERSMYTVYVHLHSVLTHSGPTTLASFRKGKCYKQLAKFFIYCAKNKLTTQKQYAEFVLVKTNKPIAQAVAMACKDYMLKDYRRFLRKHPELIDSERFFDSNLDRMTDMSFVIRAIERADIAVSYWLGRVNLDTLMAASTQAERTQFDILLDVLDKEK